MANILRRLQKLEGQLTDRTGLVPHTPRWLEYWEQRLDGILAGTDAGRIPLEAFRAVLAHATEHPSSLIHPFPRPYADD